MKESIYLVDPDYAKPGKIEELEGFKLIWYKVILRAVYDYVLYRESKNRSLKRLADSATKWLFLSALEDGSIIRNGSKVRGKLLPFNSLESLCVILDLDIEEIRKFAKKLTRKDIRKIEFFQRGKYKPRKKVQDENL